MSIPSPITWIYHDNPTLSCGVVQDHTIPREPRQVVIVGPLADDDVRRRLGQRIACAPELYRLAFACVTAGDDQRAMAAALHALQLFVHELEQKGIRPD